MGYALSLFPPYGVLLAIAYAFFFVIVVFAWKWIPGASPQHLSRDDPFVIKQRFAGCAASCVISVLSLYALAQPTEKDESFIQFIGLHLDIKAIASCLGLMVVLFMGPLSEKFVFSTSWMPDVRRMSTQHKWMSLRTYVVAPAAEEVVFRGCIGRALLAQGCTFGTVVWFGPALFAVAHLRDIVSLAKMCLMKQKVPPLRIANSILPLFFKQIFGMLSMFCLLRTGSVIAVIFAHSFCNYMGFPCFGFVHFSDIKDKIVGACYVIGLFFFFRLAWPLTDGFDSTYA